MLKKISVVLASLYKAMSLQLRLTPNVCAYLRDPGMLLLEVGIRGTPSLGRLRLELLPLEAIPFSSLCWKLFWLSA